MVHLNRTPEPVPALDAPATGTGLYRCGALTYTFRGLVALFAWLLWGDFCFNLMEAVAPSVVPVKLKLLGASNTTMSIILTTLPGIMNMTMCPWVSSASDRYRSKWGRRIPFIIWTMPFLTVSLILLGWSEQITSGLQHLVPRLAQVAPATITIVLIGAFMTCFAFFNMFVGSVFWYLFNDVVPPQFLGRFWGLFRIVSSGASALYNYYVFKHAETHMREILTGAALLYLIGFGIMCLRVKEGSYPPPPDNAGEVGLMQAIRIFVKQSFFSGRFYWLFYLNQTFGIASNLYLAFNLFFLRDMGLTLEQVGKFTAYGFIAQLLATYVTAVFVDRWHPLRVRMYVSIFTAATGFSSMVWVLVTKLPPDTFFWVYLGSMLVTKFGLTLMEGTEIPVFMRLMPKSLYGQFSSANALVRTFGGAVVASVVFGVCMDLTKSHYGGSDFAYRWLFMWPWIFNIGATVFVCLGYREWKRLGGDDNYRPPAPWTAEGFEEVADKVTSAPLRLSLVMISMWLSLVGSLINVVLVLVFMYIMKEHEMHRSFAWYATYFIPIKLVLTAVCFWQLVSVRRDIEAQERGQRRFFGIPHHGVLMVNAIQGLAYFPVYWYQTITTIHMGMEHEQIIFGVFSLLGTVAAIVAVQAVRLVERPVTVYETASVQPHPAGQRAFPAMSATNEAPAGDADETWPPA